MTNVSKTLELDVGQGYLDSATNEHGVVCCVFSTLDKIKVGTGTTTRSHYSKLFWYIEEVNEKTFTARQINQNNVPSGDEVTITLDQLLQDYSPEVQFYEDKALPAIQALNIHLQEGETHRKEDRFYSAELSFTNALAIEEKNVRALFNLGLIYLESHNMDKARDMMRELLLIKAAFKGKNQFLFNEFGIALRKNSLFDEAVEYYGKATEFAPEDENLFYNLARANYERGNWEECGDALARSRRLNPDLAAARNLAVLIIEMHAKPQLCKKQGKPTIPDDTLALISATSKELEHPETHDPEAGTAKIKRARGNAIPSEIHFDL